MMEDDQYPLTTAGHQSAHILLDAIAAWDGANPNDFTASNLAVQRLLEVGAVRAQVNEATGLIDVDIADVLQGATTTMVMMIAAIAAQFPALTMLDVIAGFRKQLDLLPRV